MTSDDIAPLIELKNSQGGTATVESLKQMITMLVGKLTAVFFVLDGLDNAQGPSGNSVTTVIDFLLTLRRDGLPVRLWFSSQPRSFLSTLLSGVPKLQVQAEMAGTVEAYVKMNIDKVRDGYSPDAWKHVVNELLKLVDGNFMLATHVLTVLVKAPFDAALMKVFNGEHIS